MIITIDDIPPSNNQFIGKGQQANWRRYQDEKKKWNLLVRSALNRSGYPAEPLERAYVEITYIFPNRRRRDPDNYAGKMLLDPLVEHGVIKDDSFDVVRLSLHASVKPGIRRTTIEVIAR